MNPLAVLFGTAVNARNLLYDRGVLPVKKLHGPVISVGNVSVGGSGKTPFVMLLGELLKARGINFDILSRGYGRQTQGVAMVDPEGRARDFGDEPLLIARRLKVSVIIGESRYKAGIFAEERLGPQIHLLDDGFQHRSLARQFDIVLAAPEDFNDRLLPAGRLREPITALRRADAVVFTNDEPVDSMPLEGKLLWRARRSIQPKNVPPRPVVFCGIARPQAFLAQLHTAGIEPAAKMFYRDHHAYSEQDVDQLMKLSQEHNAGGFVTTEKDAINLGEYLPTLKPMAIVPVKMELVDAANVVDTILRVVEERMARA